MRRWLGGITGVAASAGTAFAIAACSGDATTDEGGTGQIPATSVTTTTQDAGTTADADAPREGTATADGGDADAAADAPPPKPPMLVTDGTLDVAGVARAYVLARPSTYDASRTYPLVLALHGDGGDGPSLRAAYPFDDVSAQDAFVVYPSGANGAWDLYGASSANQDEAFLVALIASLESAWSIDPARVFGTGFSKGAFMLNQLACRRPTMFRAIAPHSGGAPYEPSDPSASHFANGYTKCAAQSVGNAPAVLVVHGESDSVVPFDGGRFSADYWAFVNGCGTSRSTPGAVSPCVMQDGCGTGHAVGLCAIPGLDHAPWANAATAAWTFFSAQ